MQTGWVRFFNIHDWFKLFGNNCSLSTKIKTHNRESIQHLSTLPAKKRPKNAYFMCDLFFLASRGLSRRGKNEREGRKSLSFLSFLPRRERPLLAGKVFSGKE